MAVDLALDAVLGDLVATPSGDIMLVSGTEEVEQRIRTRLKVTLGAWALEPALGSSVASLLRLPSDMAAQQLPLTVKEALAPMSDVQVQDVVAWVDSQDSRKVDFTVTYVLVDSESAGQQIVFSDSIVVGT